MTPMCFQVHILFLPRNTTFLSGRPIVKDDENPVGPSPRVTSERRGENSTLPYPLRPFDLTPNHKQTGDDQKKTPQDERLLHTHRSSLKLAPEPSGQQKPAISTTREAFAAMTVSILNAIPIRVHPRQDIFNLSSQPSSTSSRRAFDRRRVLQPIRPKYKRH